MATILKYHVEPSEHVQTIKVARGANIVSVIEQDNKIALYAVTEHPYWKSLDPDEKRIFVVGTGWEVDRDGLFLKQFIGTVKIGSFVWHVFEVDDLPF